MKINTKCSLALHILIAIAVFSDKVKMTSEIIAKSTGSNPVIIRNILGSLKQAGIVAVHRGSGGAELAIPPAEITIWKVYSAVDPTSMHNLIGLHTNPSSACPIGRKIYDLLDEPYSAIRESIQASMSKYTLADLLARYEA
jgi:Rrf2 family protein